MVEFQMIVYEPHTWTVYVHECMYNHKKYVGITGQEVNIRWRNGNGYASCPYFNNAILKYGWDNFYHFIIYNNVTQNEASLLEDILIKSLHTKYNEYGYNYLNGGYNNTIKEYSEYEDIIGKKFGRLMVDCIKQWNGVKDSIFKCICDCGNKKLCSYYDLIYGNVKSCGCLRGDLLIQRNIENTKHNMCNTPIYKTWASLKNRKDAEDNICDEWLVFSNFYNWAIQNNYENGQVVYLVDKNKQYSPNNCKLIDQHLYRIMNSNSANYYEYNGETQTLRYFSQKYNIKLSALRQRIAQFGSIKKAIETKTYKDIVDGNVDNEIAKILDNKLINSTQPTRYKINDSIVTCITNNDKSFIIDYDDLIKIVPYNWYINQRNIVYSQAKKDQKNINLKALILGIPPHNISKINIIFNDNNNLNYRRSNVLYTYPDGCNPNVYDYFIYNTNIKGLSFRQKHWIVKINPNSYKYLNSFVDALLLYDDIYHTNHFNDYLEFLKEAKAV